MAFQDLFPSVDEADWRDGRWQQRRALRSADELSRLVRLTDDERRGLALAGRPRIAVTPYYASLVDPAHPFCPIRMQAIPVAAEGARAPGDLRDPLGEDAHRPLRAVVHKYRDRALLLVTDTCAVYCRHCTRRRITGGDEPAFDHGAIEEALGWLKVHPEVRDVIVSGGDPLVLSDDRLDALLQRVRALPHVEVIRVATRAPVVNPMRVTDALARVLRRARAFAVTHFNHPKECTPEAREACERLVDHGVPVENQTVLLRRVNSTARIIADLNRRLVSWRVRPYYLHQGDVAEGTAHFRTALSTGVEILEALRADTSGLAIPHLAVDLPGGAGKVTIGPDWFLRASPSPGDARGVMGGARGHWLRSPAGARCFYPDPPDADASCPYDEVFYG